MTIMSITFLRIFSPNYPYNIPSKFQNICSMIEAKFLTKQLKNGKNGHGGMRGGDETVTLGGGYENTDKR